MKLDAWWYSDEEWRGYVPLDRRRDLLDHHAFVTWVAGITHYPAAVDLPDFAPGSEVVLRPEPDNPFDPNAVGVYGSPLRGLCLSSLSTPYRPTRSKRGGVGEASYALPTSRRAQRCRSGSRW